MLKKLLIILCTTLSLQATPGVIGEPIDVTSLHDITYEYDDLNRVTKATYASGESIGYAYDAGGNLLEVVFDDPNEVEKPNLAFYKDELWDDVIVINDYPPTPPSEKIREHNSTNVFDDELVYAATYSFYSATFDQSFSNQVSVYIDGNYIRSSGGYVIDPFNNYRFYIYGFITLSSGKHGIKLVLDPDDIVDESNENDNVLEKTFYVMSRDGDSDNDGIKDTDEGIIDTDGDGTVNFLDTDSDDDGMNDKDEHEYGLDPLDSSDANKDLDGDGVSNIDEITAGTDPNVKDTIDEQNTTNNITNVLTTGQTISYVDYDDGYYQRGVKRSFSRIGDTVVDNGTGLMWQDDSDVSNRKTLTNINSYCENLNLSNYSDWRTPNADEAFTLLEEIEVGSEFKNTITEILTSTYRTSNNQDYYYYLSRDQGLESKPLSYFQYFGGSFVRCVRGKSLQKINNLIHSNEKQLVIDVNNKLMWLDKSSLRFTWENAINYCESLSIEGFTDWTLPNKNESYTLNNEYNRYTSKFKNPLFEEYNISFWTSSVHLGNNNRYYALGNYMTHSSVWDKHMHHALCVRPISEVELLEWYDADNDGIANIEDDDDDGDGINDVADMFPLDSSESVDTDGDGIGNNTDNDDDGDGIIDAQDSFPLDNTESLDTDDDGIGNNEDEDDDGDGINDVADMFPLNSSESLDTDSDGTGNNADMDDDGDGIPDVDEIKWHFDPLDASDGGNADTDSDGISNIDEINAGTNPNQNDATIQISPIDNIYVMMNTQITPITIEANASNGSSLTYKVISSNLDVVVASIGDNLITLTQISNTIGDANITVIANLGERSESITFEVHIKQSVISLEDGQSGVYEPHAEFRYSTQLDGTQIDVNVEEDGTLVHRVIRDGIETYLHVVIAGAEVRLDHEHTATITLPTQHDVYMLMGADGRVTPDIQGALLPKGALPLGTQIEADDKKVKFTIPMPARLEF